MYFGCATLRQDKLQERGQTTFEEAAQTHAQTSTAIEKLTCITACDLLDHSFAPVEPVAL